MGFTGLPVPPITRNGAIWRWKSHRCRSRHAAARGSRSQLASSHNPIATMPMLWTGLWLNWYPDGTTSWAVSAPITATSCRWNHGRQAACQPARDEPPRPIASGPLRRSRSPYPVLSRLDSDLLRLGRGVEFVGHDASAWFEPVDGLMTGDVEQHSPSGDTCTRRGDSIGQRAITRRDPCCGPIVVHAPIEEHVTQAVEVGHRIAVKRQTDPLR